MSTKTFKFPLKAEVRDTMSGFVGRIEARTEWSNGCVRYQIRPHIVEKDGEPHKLPDSQCFDEEQLELASAISDPIVDQVKQIESCLQPFSTGGDRPDPGRKPDPTR